MCSCLCSIYFLHFSPTLNCMPKYQRTRQAFEYSSGYVSEWALYHCLILDWEQHCCAIQTLQMWFLVVKAVQLHYVHSQASHAASLDWHISRADCRVRDNSLSNLLRVQSSSTPSTMRSLIRLSVSSPNSHVLAFVCRSVTKWSMGSPGNCLLLLNKCLSQVTFFLGLQQASNLAMIGFTFISSPTLSHVKVLYTSRASAIRGRVRNIASISSSFPRGSLQGLEAQVFELLHFCSDTM